jgi:hypothetical protein
MEIPKFKSRSWLRSHPILEASKNLKIKSQREIMKKPKSPGKPNDGRMPKWKINMTKSRSKQNEDALPK